MQLYKHCIKTRKNKADDGTEDTSREAHRHQGATCACIGNIRGDRVQLPPLEVEIPEAK